MLIQKVISGGQTGVDQAALYAAKALGIATGGWIPKGCPTTNGNNPSLLEKFDLTEHTSPKYPPRTFANVKDADGTLRVAKIWNSAGEKLTLKAILQYNRPYLDVDANNLPHPGVLKEWVLLKGISTINVAGNSEKTAPQIFKIAEYWLKIAFEFCLLS